MSEKNKKVVKKIENKNKKVTNQKSKAWWLLGFLFPVVGIILYLVWKNKDKESAKNIGTGTIIGAGLWLFIGLSFMISTNAEPKEKEEEKVDVVKWYNETLEKEPVVTIIAMSTCGHCQEYKPVITELANKYGFKLYFYESDLLSKEEYSTVSESYELKGYEGYVPYTFITKSGKFVADTTGYSSKTSIVDFLKENGVIKN